MLKKCRTLAVISAGTYLIFSNMAHASDTMFEEINDAGSLVSTAQKVTGVISTIVGKTGAGDQEDLYRFKWSGGNLQVATDGSFGSSYSFATVLYLFDERGNYINSNDGSTPLTKPTSLSVANLSPGIYHIGISGSHPGEYVISFNENISSPNFDLAPSPFTFTDIADAEPNIVYMSNPILVAGVDEAIPVMISNGEYRVNRGEWRTASTNVYTDDLLEVRLMSSDAFDTTASAVLTIGSMSDAFDITTKADSPTQTNTLSYAKSCNHIDSSYQ